MPTAPPPSRDPALEAHLLWHKYKAEVGIAVVLVLLAIVGIGAYRFYFDRQQAAASALLAGAKTPQDYEQVVAQYSKTPSGAAAYLLLAQAQRDDRKFAESNATLQTFIDKNSDHELVGSAQMGIASNLEAMGKVDEALAMYQQVAAKYANTFNAPLALVSQVALLTAKQQQDAARRICETILMQYHDSFWAGEAMRQLRSLKPSSPPKSAGPATLPPGAPGAVPEMLRPPMAAPAAPRPAAAPTVNPPKPK